jgi:hypothetical protein
MAELEVRLVDEATFDEIPDPAQPGARCQTCDYWERLEGGREPPSAEAGDADARAGLKRGRLLAGRRLAGAYAMVAFETDAVARTAVGYAQFGPISAYPRAQVIRDRYPQLPDSPAPWVVTCLQVAPTAGDAPHRDELGVELLGAVCSELDRRGITAVEAYPEAAVDGWLPSAGPATVYESAGFTRAAGDERYPVYRRELSGEADSEAWGDLLRAGQPSDEADAWPPPPPRTPDADDFFRLPPERPKRPNPFGED